MYTMGHPHCPFPAWYCRTLGYTQAFRAKAWFAYSAMPRLRCLRTKRELNIYPLLIKGRCLTSLVHKMTSFYSKDQWWSHFQISTCTWIFALTVKSQLHCVKMYGLRFWLYNTSDTPTYMLQYLHWRIKYRYECVSLRSWMRPSLACNITVSYTHLTLPTIYSV